MGYRGSDGLDFVHSFATLLAKELVRPDAAMAHLKAIGFRSSSMVVVGNKNSLYGFFSLLYVFDEDDVHCRLTMAWKRDTLRSHSLVRDDGSLLPFTLA